MAHPDEPSSPPASAKFIKDNFEQDYLYLLKNNVSLIQQKMLEALTAQASSILTLEAKPKDSNNLDFIYAIDGSIIDFKQTVGYEEKVKYGLQIGAAFLDVSQLKSPDINKFGNINPFFISNLYGSEKNFSFSSILPGKNIYSYDNNLNIQDLKVSFLDGIELMFSKDPSAIELYKHMVQEYFSQDIFIDCQNIGCELKNKPSTDIKQKCNACNSRAVEKIKFIKDITNDIETDSLYADTNKQSKDLMLTLENFLVTYIIKNHNLAQKLGIVLDGRLQNKYVGQYVNHWLTDNKDNYKNTTLMGIQKSGILNHYLSSLHQVLKSSSTVITDATLLAKVNEFKDGKGFILPINPNFKRLAGLKNIKQPGSYGLEVLVITPEPKRREFVMTLPTGKSWSPTSSQMITNFLTLTQTDLYYKSKGAIVANILAHENVSLNKKQTNRADKSEIDTKNKKPII